MHDDLQNYLWKQIPISHAMGVHVRHASLGKVVLGASFDANINHKKTVFGGSLHALATLACWSLVHLNMQDLEQDDIQIVISHSAIDYLAPVITDFEAVCEMASLETWNKFLSILVKKGKARLKLSAKIFQEDELAVDFQGTFVALRTSER